MWPFLLTRKQRKCINISDWSSFCQNWTVCKITVVECKSCSSTQILQGRALFSGKFSTLAQILHDQRSRQSWKISTQNWKNTNVAIHEEKNEQMKQEMWLQEVFCKRKQIDVPLSSGKPALRLNESALRQKQLPQINLEIILNLHFSLSSTLFRVFSLFWKVV